jgi:hypothetical protein
MAVLDYVPVRVRAFHHSIMPMSLTKSLFSAVAVLLLLFTLYSMRGSTSRLRVVLLTGLTSKTLKEFENVDDFYEKLWNNRLTYAMRHGISSDASE